MEKSDNLNIIKLVCPPAEELSVIVNNVKCDQCGLIFQNESRLRFHDLKVHQHKNLDKIIKECVRYHCPETSCVYSVDSNKYFTTMKYLKQHYLKVHAVKQYPCPQCDKGFSTEAAKAAHMRICGLEFICDCLKSFSSYEALLTHARRQSHHVDEKYKNILKKTNQKHSSTQLIPIKSIKKIPITILPYEENNLTSNNNLQFIKNTRSVAIQTDDLKKLKRIPSPSKLTKRRESRQTQTQTNNNLSKEKRCRKTVETQTSPTSRDLNKKSINIKKQKNNNLLKEKSDDKKLTINNTFTDDNLFTNSPLPLNEMQDLWEERNNQSSPSSTTSTTSTAQTHSCKSLLDVFNNSVNQTELIPYYDQDDGMENNYKMNLTSSTSTSNSYINNYYANNETVSRLDPMLTEELFSNRFSSIETQTDKPDFSAIFETDNSLSLSSNIETQTTEHFEDIELFYSNMYTQTCNDMFTCYTDLGLADIQTQTAWSELDNTTIDTIDNTSSTDTLVKTNATDTSTGEIQSISDTEKCHIEPRSWLIAQTTHEFDEFQ